MLLKKYYYKTLNNIWRGKNILFYPDKDVIGTPDIIMFATRYGLEYRTYKYNNILFVLYIMYNMIMPARVEGTEGVFFFSRLLFP